MLRFSVAESASGEYNNQKSCRRRSFCLTISYNKLWKLLIDKKISSSELRKSVGIAPNTMTRLRKDEEVSLAVLNRICSSLNVDIGDVMEFLPDNE